jgi:hypothetical protein
MKPTLSVVAPDEPLPVKAQETVGERVRRLQAEAKGLALEHVRVLARAMVDIQMLAAEIAEGGDVYAPGARDLARRLAEDLDARVQTLEAITARSAP